ncbi:YchJ family protein [Rheinheimera sp. MMS21-TC3]|uniref:YchJ family protein n=1 Tax=Rheinheimera sp. MMS21-TC3 TaxID=3072790 RepID=UPI0028C41B27|nr:YchJ family metal-binding protein [Rheinheimera sp. MMS21-TC3]WNO60826.1 YchJ family metal-binding protein [Rheinheimera sp. MMS21-TC3]
MRCFCGSQQSLIQCCQPYINNTQQVQNCEQLMRSRYSAYCLKDSAYIYATYHPSMRLNNSIQQITDFAQSSHFINLQIISSQQESNEGWVKFTVAYLQGNTLFQFTENSRFVFDTRWLYVAGDLTEYPSKKIGRNDLCPCGSKKKLKQCLIHLPSGSSNLNY